MQRDAPCSTSQGMVIDFSQLGGHCGREVRMGAAGHLHPCAGTIFIFCDHHVAELAQLGLQT